MERRKWVAEESDLFGFLFTLHFGYWTEKYYVLFFLQSGNSVPEIFACEFCSEIFNCKFSTVNFQQEICGTLNLIL